MDHLRLGNFRRKAGKQEQERKKRGEEGCWGKNGEGSRILSSYGPKSLNDMVSRPPR